MQVPPTNTGHMMEMQDLNHVYYYYFLAYLICSAQLTILESSFCTSYEVANINYESVPLQRLSILLDCDMPKPDEAGLHHYKCSFAVSKTNSKVPGGVMKAVWSHNVISGFEWWMCRGVSQGRDWSVYPRTWLVNVSKGMIGQCIQGHDWSMLLQ